MEMNFEEELLIKAAWYYYIEEMTQQNIAEKLGISRMKVIKLLETAKSTGVIQFKISQEKSRRLRIEKKLVETWGLKDAFVIPTPDDSAVFNESLAKAAAMYIADRMTENTFINMGYGDTPSRVLNHLATITDHPVSIVSLTGGVSYYLPNTVSSVFKAKLYLYPAPLMLSSKELCKAISEEPGIKEIKRMVKLASMSIIGIGAMNDDATIISNGILTKNDFTYLSLRGAVGDIMTHFIDKDGNPVLTDIDERLISTSLDTLKELNNVIGIAGGKHKTDVISAALKGRYLDILITDEETANSLIGG